MGAAFALLVPLLMCFVNRYEEHIYGPARSTVRRSVLEMEDNESHHIIAHMKELRDAD
jgi:hypothetical protein